MIFIDGKPFVQSSASSNPSQCDDDAFLSSLLQHPYLIDACERFKFMPEWNISEKSMLDGVKHVYVFQREYATVIPALVQFVGTDEATTCVCMAIRNRDNGMTSVAHLDSPKIINSGLLQMLSLLIDQDTHPTLDVHLVGAFDDTSCQKYVSDGDDDVVGGSNRAKKSSMGYSVPLCSKIIQVLSDSSEKFHIGTLCVLGHNTQFNSAGETVPIFTGLVVETESGSVMPAQFSKGSRCPDDIVRAIRITMSFDDITCRGRLLETYDTKQDRFEITACSWNPEHQLWAFSMLQLSDSELLEQCSTSPSAESPDFVENQRRKFRYLINYPHWTDTFNKGKPRVFKRNVDGGWSVV
ncbi:hypothetical protein ZOSMA_181G00140 [Zostera marina]|uniref:Protein N-terminal asparagine amidohydrolase n=1 Tax=Zostera marina TaxID=29655 RepID=A0A0K9PQY6_ZOSMR|nr:hypothetical protein ZOSMA_181G00140 [Zostera marina]